MYQTYIDNYNSNDFKEYLEINRKISDYRIKLEIVIKIKISILMKIKIILVSNTKKLNLILKNLYINPCLMKLIN